MKKTKIECLGFIMDGNRRWAKEQGKETVEGHSRGHGVFQDCVRWVRDEQISHAVFYAFSTENWKRKKEEVDYLVQMFEQVLTKILKGVEEEKVRIRIVGQKSDFAPKLQKLMSDVEEKSAQYKDTTIWIALSYGGRAELLEGINKAVENGVRVTEESFKNFLWTAEMPDPDMIVRTSNEHRLSNFITWGSVYSELYFMEKHWPSLTKKDFEDILIEYESRERRKGK
jgi:undecaprenyl diphosphate synthase